jgi:hypothetical protein
MPHLLENLDNLTNGYVLNAYSRRAGNTIHPWNCHHVRRMTVPPRKVWGSTIGELEQWLNENGKELDPMHPHCRYCQ